MSTVTSEATGTALRHVREQIKAKLDEFHTSKALRDAKQSELDNIADTADRERRDLSTDETTRFAEIRAEIAPLDEKLAELGGERDALEERERLLLDSEVARQAADDTAKRFARPVDADQVNAPARVRSEARTYTADAERRGVSFFADIYRAQRLNDPAAIERMQRHGQEALVHELAGTEARDVGTSAFAGLTVPAYLTELVAPSAKAMAPTVDICARHPLPPAGMTVNISRITTAAAVGVQATQNSGVTETNMDDTLLAPAVNTYAGMQDVSRQALERGTGIDSIVMSDLERDYWTKVDNAILNSDGTGGTHLSIRSTTSIIAVTYTDATPTVAELYPKLADLISQIMSGVFMGVTHFIMHPRRWWWLASSVGTSFPFLNIDNSQTVQAGNVGTTEYFANNRNILGVPVVLDGNMATNVGAGTEDVILGVCADELHFWDEGGPKFIRTEQALADQLSVRFVLYGYSAFTAGRYPGAHGTISGTGLIAPTF